MNYSNLVEKATSKIMATKGKGPRNLTKPAKPCPDCGKPMSATHKC